MRAVRSSLRARQAVALVMVSTLLLSSLPNPTAVHLPAPLSPSIVKAAQSIEPGQDAGQGPIGSLRFAAEVDADGDPATNPTRARGVPVARIGAMGSMLPVLYTSVVLAVEVIPTRQTRNPAGTRVTFRLRNEASQVDITRETTADAWGAAFVEIMLDDLHLAGTGVPTLVPHHRAGTARLLFVTNRDRSPQAPDVPTAREAGYPDLPLSFWRSHASNRAWPNDRPRPSRRTNASAQGAAALFAS